MREKNKERGPIPALFTHGWIRLAAGLRLIETGLNGSVRFSFKSTPLEKMPVLDLSHYKEIELAKINYALRFVKKDELTYPYSKIYAELKYKDSQGEEKVRELSESDLHNLFLGRDAGILVLDNGDKKTYGLIFEDKENPLKAFIGIFSPSVDSPSALVESMLVESDTALLTFIKSYSSFYLNNNLVDPQVKDAVGCLDNGGLPEKLGVNELMMRVFMASLVARSKTTVAESAEGGELAKDLEIIKRLRSPLAGADKFVDVKKLIHEVLGRVLANHDSVARMEAVFFEKPGTKRRIELQTVWAKAIFDYFEAREAIEISDVWAVRYDHTIYYLNVLKFIADTVLVKQTPECYQDAILLLEEVDSFKLEMELMAKPYQDALAVINDELRYTLPPNFFEEKRMPHPGQIANLFKSWLASITAKEAEKARNRQGLI